MAKRKKPEPRPAYGPETRTEILSRIADGESVAQICKSKGMPTQSEVYDWLNEEPEFAERYARAREQQAEKYAQEIREIADEEPPMVATQFSEHVDSGWLQWQKNRIDARKWIASKLLPKKYGDKVELGGPDGGSIPVSLGIRFVSPDEKKG